ncbi:hypothetical protein [Cytobacillus firmus]|uniref:hypothetical protein n=1 Tax=Cytobacillus firmus TaxID=1399 RepID=UPI002FFFF349
MSDEKVPMPGLNTKEDKAPSMNWHIKWNGTGGQVHRPDWDNEPVPLSHPGLLNDHAYYWHPCGCHF